LSSLDGFYACFLQKRPLEVNLRARQRKFQANEDFQPFYIDARSSSLLSRTYVNTPSKAQLFLLCTLLSMRAETVNTFLTVSPSESLCPRYLILACLGACSQIRHLCRPITESSLDSVLDNTDLRCPHPYTVFQG